MYGVRMSKVYQLITKSTMLKPSANRPNCSFVHARPIMTPVRKFVAFAATWSARATVPLRAVASDTRPSTSVIDVGS